MRFCEQHGLVLIADEVYKVRCLLARLCWQLLLVAVLCFCEQLGLVLVADEVYQVRSASFKCLRWQLLLSIVCSVAASPVHIGVLAVQR